LTADRAFMSADGVVAKRGLCEASLDQAYLKSTMIRQSRELVVLADASKVGRADSTAWTLFPSSWRLVTDASPKSEDIVDLIACGAKPIFVAPGNEAPDQA
ncbi:MAG: transcriptional regulator, DeoR family, partial [Alphaproteobacteria bacterium]|nr:transcriptional regulator, DeoR family [Alphaproteobacteria bacterium]